jgi:putative intracellular protease/amidase
MRKLVHFLVFHGYPDYEAALVLAELRRSGHYGVVTVGFSKEDVTSMGGLRVSTDVALEELPEHEVELLILPGGDDWKDRLYPEKAVNEFLRGLDACGARIAAICGATVALARAGLLDERAHTSNFAAYLGDNGDGYAGAAMYRDDLAVRDDRVITASGLGSVEFAREVLAELEVFERDMLAKWYETYKHGRYVLPGA